MFLRDKTWMEEYRPELIEKYPQVVGVIFFGLGELPDEEFGLVPVYPPSGVIIQLSKDESTMSFSWKCALCGMRHQRRNILLTCLNHDLGDHFDVIKKTD